MKMALTDGMVRIIEADAIQKTIIKSLYIPQCFY